ncbi:L-rhamnose mutarotase [Adhaeribacter aquaticus]|uniref:L-rhamnose mutarotase n=1 Tax=Adhaeribacter aquaticus TaxID=299567 RepID=UPI0004792D59|nr:L-rhamnose mutarotase [Adhaeribacter aquaticus]
MTRMAFKMQVFKGYEAEYQRRHDEIWPELQSLLKENGISEYAIFLDLETNSLFAYLQAENPTVLDKLPEQPIMQKWWAYMQDIMETNPDHSPVSKPLPEVFYLP